MLEWPIVLVCNISLFCCYCSVTKSWITLCNPMDFSTLGLSVLHQLPELAQTHVHWVGDAIQPSHLLSSPSPPAFNLSQHLGLFESSWLPHIRFLLRGRLAIKVLSSATRLPPQSLKPCHSDIAWERARVDNTGWGAAQILGTSNPCWERPGGRGPGKEAGWLLG